LSSDTPSTNLPFFLAGRDAVRKFLSVSFKTPTWVQSEQEVVVETLQNGKRLGEVSASGGGKHREITIQAQKDTRWLWCEQVPSETSLMLARAFSADVKGKNPVNLTSLENRPRSYLKKWEDGKISNVWRGTRYTFLQSDSSTIKHQHINRLTNKLQHTWMDCWKASVCSAISSDCNFSKSM
jgi:hypothetical protein